MTAEMLWIGIRAGIYGCFPLLVAMLFGLDPAPGMLLVPLFCFITALGFAALAARWRPAAWPRSTSSTT